MRMSIKILCILLGSYSFCFGQCKTINVEAKITNTEGGLKNGKIVLDLKNSRVDDFSISLFGSKTQNKLKVDKAEIDNLAKGSYLIVIVGRKEQDNYCPKSINVTIN